MWTYQDIKSGRTQVTMFGMKSKEEKVWPIGSGNMFFRRTTDRYGKKGTISANRGFMSVKRNASNGRFTKIEG